MINIIEALVKAFTDNQLNIYEDNLPFNYDLKNQVGLFYNIDNVQDEDYRQDISFTINLVATKKNRYKQLAVLTRVEAILNKIELTADTQIIKKNVYLNTLNEEDKKTFILEFWIKNYK